MLYPNVKYFGSAHPDDCGAATVRELHSRVTDGIDVRLMWCGRDGRIWVAVCDTKTGDAFSVPVQDGERALDVFHHPYAYAASQSAGRGRTARPFDTDTPLAA
ncbi:MAG TPA: hypothetical protein VMT10_06055 [Solirubrobacteraceae bacterium]|nr:hypothetical protein [Solirubrobacteraceae bacterium]